MKRHPFPVESRMVTVYLSGGRTAFGETFKELATLPRMHEEVPRGFALKAQVGGNRLEVVLKSWGSQELVVEVSSDDNAFEQELLGKLQNWLSDIQPKPWLQWWLANASFFSFLAFAWCMLCLFALAVISKPENAPSLIRQEAYEMAKSGVNSSNETRAVQLILSIESGYEPKPSQMVHHYPGVRFRVFFLVGLSVLVALRVAPTGGVGLWGGKRSIEKQRLWLKTVSISVPGVVGSSFILPWLAGLLGWAK